MSRRRWTATVTGVLTSVLVVASATAAHADPQGRILEISSKQGKISVLFSGVGLAAGQSIDPSSITMTVDDLPVRVTSKPVTEATAVQRTAMVTIDTSGSMKAAGRLDAAKTAAESFISSLPADVRVGLVTFSTTALIKVPPTTDHSVVATAVDGLVATGNTALYDATELTLKTAGTTGARTVLLLSDGVDDGSTSKLPAVLDAVKASGVQLSAVALGAEAAGAEPLKQIATSSGGTVLQALQSSDLAGAFQEASRAISSQLVISASLPPGIRSSGNLVVSAKAGGTLLTDTAFTTFSAAPKPKPTAAPVAGAADTGTLSHSWALYAATGALFLGLLLVLLLASSSETLTAGSSVNRRLSIYTLTGRQRGPALKETSVLGDSAVARTAMDFADRVVAQRGVEATLERRLDAAGVPLRPAEWLLVQIGAPIGLALVMLLLSGADLVAIALGFILGGLLPYAYLSIKRSRRLSAFLAQLPDTLQLVSGSLSAGYSLPQALDTVVREGQPPISQEFNRAFVESRLGVPITEALDGIAQRMESEDFGWVVLAIRIQSDVGGNLGEVLSTVSATLRERERLRRQVKVLSAEGRLSAWILGSLPPVFGLYLVLAKRSYIQPLFTDPIGIFMLIGMSVLMTIGAFWLSRVVKVRV